MKRYSVVIAIVLTLFATFWPGKTIKANYYKMKAEYGDSSVIIRHLPPCGTATLSETPLGKDENVSWDVFCSVVGDSPVIYYLNTNAGFSTNYNVHALSIIGQKALLSSTKINWRSSENILSFGFKDGSVYYTTELRPEFYPFLVVFWLLLSVLLFLILNYVVVRALGHLDIVIARRRPLIQKTE